MMETYDAVVVGGGPSGASAAHELAKHGRSVLLLDRAGRIKPCGGAIPPRLIQDFGIPDHLLCARITSARMVAPSSKGVDMPINTDSPTGGTTGGPAGGFVGMVNREDFDEWLRERAAKCGAERIAGQFAEVTRDPDGVAVVNFRRNDAAPDMPAEQVRARVVVGSDGARSNVAKQCVKGTDHIKYVFAYHEIIKAPSEDFHGNRCDVYYQGKISPDFYGWVFPHGSTASVGSGSARKGFSIRKSVTTLRAEAGLTGAETIRREGAPIPMRLMRCWNNGRDVVLAGDASGVVAPASGEGIYYAMEGGRLAGEAAEMLLATGNVKALRTARKRFMRAHGRVFMILGIMQWFWYSSDKRRERFVTICEDKDVQRLTWESYMNKKLVRKDLLAHLRIFFKDLGHLLGLVDA